MLRQADHRPRPCATPVAAVIAGVPHATVRIWKHRGWLTDYGRGLADPHEVATLAWELRELRGCDSDVLAS